MAANTSNEDGMKMFKEQLIEVFISKCKSLSGWIILNDGQWERLLVTITVKNTSVTDRQTTYKHINTSNKFLTSQLFLLLSYLFLVVIVNDARSYINHWWYFWQKYKLVFHDFWFRIIPIATSNKSQFTAKKTT